MSTASHIFYPLARLFRGAPMRQTHSLTPPIQSQTCITDGIRYVFEFEALDEKFTLTQNEVKKVEEQLGSDT